MPLRFRRRVRLGPVILNFSNSGMSWTLKVGPWSWNSRTRAQTVDLPGPVSWTGRRTRRRARRSGDTQ